MEKIELKGKISDNIPGYQSEGGQLSIDGAIRRFCAFYRMDCEKLTLHDTAYSMRSEPDRFGLYRNLEICENFEKSRKEQGVYILKDDISEFYLLASTPTSMEPDHNQPIVGTSTANIDLVTLNRMVLSDSEYDEIADICSAIITNIIFELLMYDGSRMRTHVRTSEEERIRFDEAAYEFLISDETNASSEYPLIRYALCELTMNKLHAIYRLLFNTRIESPFEPRRFVYALSGGETGEFPDKFIYGLDGDGRYNISELMRYYRAANALFAFWNSDYCKCAVAKIGKSRSRDDAAYEDTMLACIGDVAKEFGLDNMMKAYEEGVPIADITA